MGKRQKSFSEPKYEINVESKDKVLIRQEKRNPLWRLFVQMIVTSVIAYAVILILALLYNSTSHLFVPSKIVISPLYGVNAEPLSGQACEEINVYIDGRKKPLPKKISRDGISVPFKRRGQHLIGIENVNSRLDSLAFAQEKRALDSLDLAKDVYSAIRPLSDYVFHQVVDERDFSASRFLYFIQRKPYADKPYLLFFSKPDKAAIHFGEAAVKNMSENSTVLKDFYSSLYSRISPFCPDVGHLTDDFLNRLEQTYAVDIPRFDGFEWFSENRMKRFRYADGMRQLFRSSVFILPYIEKDPRSRLVARLVLSFADVGATQFDAIEIKNIELTEREIVPPDAALFEIIGAYLHIYYSFLSSGSTDESDLRDLIAVCNRSSPDVDALDLLGNRVVRRSSMPHVRALADFFARIERLQCRQLYDELASFWQNDPYNLGAIGFTAQEKEVMRAIIKYTLALKENEHRCVAQEWPNIDQRLALFSQAKKMIDTTVSLAWLQDEVLYAVLKAEIANLDQKL
ncbi:hypothetical protein JXA02_02405 [candidate division KSB1 bacterium]|nr:hypothetical protein [candidate division KSB1 bacterium]RQW10206.1 MAG: hypothetical protein EH222_02630 [candidate division KSB1 bacterium]